MVAGGEADGGGWKAIAEEWGEHWRTGLATMIGIGLCTSVTPIVFSLFIQPLEKEFNWSRGEVSSAQSFSILSALLAPFVGRLLDLRGVRSLMLLGMFGYGLGYVLYAVMPGQLWQFYAITAVMTILGVPTSGLAFGRVISSVFIRTRGFSLAAGRSGMAVSGILLPPMLYFAISHYGWRGGYLAMAGLVLLVALPAAWTWIEKGSAARVGEQSKPAPLRALLTDRRVPVVAFAAALAYLPILAIVSQLQPLLTEDGVPPATAANMIGLVGVATLIGAIGTGLLLDRFWAPMIALVMLCLAACGALLLVFSDGNLGLVALGIVLLGLGQGAEHDLVAFTVARYFGVANFSGVYGLTILAISTVSAAGYAAIGFSHDLTGGYDAALYAGAGILVLAGLLYLLLGPYPVRIESHPRAASPA